MDCKFSQLIMDSVFLYSLNFKLIKSYLFYKK